MTSGMSVEVGGTRIAYTLAGAGRPLLFIHGYPLGRSLWRPQVEALASSAVVIAPDLRGHGDSAAPAGEYSMDLLADELHGLLAALKIDQPVVLCGLSMGGYIALAYYRKFSAGVAGLVLAATRVGADSAEGKANRERTAALAVEAGVPAVVDAMLPKMLAPDTYTQNPDLVRQVRDLMLRTSLNGVLGDLAGMRNRPDSTPTLPEIRVPVLIIHGQQDQLIPPGEAQNTLSGVPSATLALIDRAGHLPNLEQPDTFNQAITNFLKSL